MPRAPRDPAIEQAMTARDNARIPSQELKGHDLASVDAAAKAMSEMLGNPMRVPDLSRAGFALVSAEIYGSSPRPSSFATRMPGSACSRCFCAPPPAPTRSR